MKITIRNSPDKDLNWYIRDILNFTADKTIPNAILRKNIQVDVVFSTTLFDFIGQAMISGYNSKKQPRKFRIVIWKYLSAREILSSMIHEMVHVKQWALGETGHHLETWMGEEVPEDLEYYDHPWEKDAYGSERCIFSQYVTKNKLWKVFPKLRNPDRKNIVPKKFEIKWKIPKEQRGKGYIPV